MRSGSLIVAATLLASGCSLVFVNSPDTKTAKSSSSVGPRCTTSFTAPMVDTILWSLAAARNGLWLSADERQREMMVGNGVPYVAAFAASGLFTISMIYGYHAVHACRAAVEARTDPYARPAPTSTREQRAADEAAEEAAVQERAQKAAADDAKAAGEAAGYAATAKPGVRPAGAH